MSEAEYAVVPLVLVIGDIVLKGMVMGKPSIRKTIFFIFAVWTIKNPGPLGTRGPWDTKSPGDDQ